MDDITVGSPNSYASSSTGSASHDGSAAAMEPASLQKLLEPGGREEGNGLRLGGGQAGREGGQQKPAKRKKGEKSTTIQTACVYCEYRLIHHCHEDGLD